MRLSIFLGTCAAAAIAISAASAAVAQRGQDSDRGTVSRLDRGTGINEMRQGKDTVDRFRANTVGTRIRQEEHPTHPDHPTHDPHHPTTDPHDPHDTPTDPHHPSTDPHDTPTDPHHPTTDPHHTDPHHTTSG